MRHRVSGRKLGRTTSHRWALFGNMARSLVEHERIETTLNRAKEMQPFADRLITWGKQNDLAARRHVFGLVRSEDIVGKLFSDLAPRFKSRAGGYSRILKLGYRLGDSAPMAVLEYLPGEAPAKGSEAEKVLAAQKPSVKKAEKKEKVAKAEKPPKVKKEKKEKAAAKKKTASSSSKKSDKKK